MIINTAILIFANSSKEEQLQKAIPNGLKLFGVLNKHTLDTVRKSGLPYFHFTEKEQQGSNFGERFTNAIEQVFDYGYENIITIGNDTPQLNKNHLIQSYELLKQQKFVLGPSQDGGFYLMGIHKSHFNPVSFLHLPWQTSKISGAISHLLIQNFKVKIYKLQPLKDIDQLEDVNQVLNVFRTISVELKYIILVILQLKKKVAIRLNTLRYKRIKLSFHNKGSPVFHLL
ncbi:DUF2064 domain-containing protein [Salegentibacter sp. JZCK2]|uniref:TIGR04282 family arsenosugar biosynthesis glycosyltransferase n=1 Tax=Salegentibacter tibetensis TaxID=2873600 RepID=UPI001CCAD4D4|nr:DUF2064 domain-containing protein [Salegentibacter tibetensis]MBZ9731547.1 DUF2064 domain-containing protein [Salegentibacter tibetensis]